MTTLTIRDIRHRWPAAEKALQTEHEIIVTRDGKPVAKLIRYTEPPKRRKRFDPVKNLAELKKISRGKVYLGGDAGLAADRADRWER